MPGRQQRLVQLLRDFGLGRTPLRSAMLEKHGVRVVCAEPGNPIRKLRLQRPSSTEQLQVKKRQASRTMLSGLSLICAAALRLVQTHRGWQASAHARATEPLRRIEGSPGTRALRRAGDSTPSDQDSIRVESSEIQILCFANRLCADPARRRAAPHSFMETETILYYTILFYTILYYTILFHTILYHTILYYYSRAGAAGARVCLVAGDVAPAPTREESLRTPWRAQA